MEVLKKGSKGNDVASLQKMLTKVGYPLVADGDFGIKTHEAVKYFQANNGLKCDCLVGQKTLEVLAGICSRQNAGLANIVKKSSRPITRIIVHCTATVEGKDYSVMDVTRMHMVGRKWPHVGYHYVVGIDGTIRPACDVNIEGIHVAGYNKNSIGVVYAGGLAKDGAPKDTRNQQQKDSLMSIVKALKELYPTAKVMGHRDLSPDRNHDGKITPDEFLKACPCFDAITEYSHLV